VTEPVCGMQVDLRPPLRTETHPRAPYTSAAPVALLPFDAEPQRDATTIAGTVLSEGSQ
jgi:hypothetical protein